MKKDTIGELLSQGNQRTSNQRRSCIQRTLISIRQLGTEDLVTWSLGHHGADEQGDWVV
jgi:hypothetical protein